MSGAPSGAEDAPLSAVEQEALRAAVGELHAWYSAEARDSPWRRTRDPYAILVAEAMLQQTQVSTVVPYFERWMERFPAVADLAAAEEREVLVCWEGLGYYRRARALHSAAKMIVAEHGGVVPSDEVALRALPGVGDYTAAAVGSIAFGRDVAVLDGNVERVLTRLLRFVADPRTAASRRALRALAERILPAGTARAHNQAMMELGARVCTPKRPSCEGCPLAGACRARAAGDPNSFPRKKKRKPAPHQHMAVAVIRDAAGRVLLYRRAYDGMLAGLWDLPALAVDEPPSNIDALLEFVRGRYGLTVEPGEALAPIKHAYTHLRVTLHPWLLSRRDAMDRRAADAGDDMEWMGRAERGSRALPRATQKVLESLEARSEL